MVRNLSFKIKSENARELKWRISIGILTLFSGITNFWGLANVERSEYYATFPNSMSRSLSNFIFGAMDPGGVVTLDKIPGSFWIPAIFVKIFGFSTWSITFPNALAAITATLVITFVVKKYYGMTAGMTAGWILATTPIVVAVARSNQPQTFYYLAIAIAIRFSIIALNESSRKNLIWAGLWIALAFHSYMLLAWALWPPLILGYLVTSQSWKNKLNHLLIAGSLSIFASGFWIFLVALIPESKRPFIGGTNTNSGLELVLGYNGLGRFTQRHISGGDFGSRTFTPPFGGEPGPFRLLNVFLIGQIGWLLPTAIISIALLVYLKYKSPVFIFATSYLILQILMFSAVKGMHQFYLSTMALPIAIIIALGIYQFVSQKKPYFIVAIVMTNLAWAFLITVNQKSYLFPAPLFQAAILIAFLVLSVFTFKRVPEIATSALFIGALIFTPALWSLDTLKKSDAYNPMAGLTFAELGIANAQKAMNRIGGIIEIQEELIENGRPEAELISYIRTQTDSKFALATFTGLTAAPYINATKDLIYPIGGFNGEDPTPTLANFKSLVDSGAIRFVLSNSGNSFSQKEPYGRNGSSKRNPGFKKASNKVTIQNWVNQNCTLNPYSIYASRLLDCKK